MAWPCIDGSPDGNESASPKATRVAFGEALSFPSGEPSIQGHAIEFRINAEDPAQNFMPSPGCVETFQPPGGPGIRLDTHLYTGYQVPPYYDSLFAKLIVSGSNRDYFHLQ